jgi:hypothetical protein
MMVAMLARMSLLREVAGDRDATALQTMSVSVMLRERMEVEGQGWTLEERVPR